MDPVTPAAATPQTPASATTVQAPVAQRAAQAAPPNSQTPAASTSGASQSPASEESKMVPITALHEEREKRQQLQVEMEALKRVAGANVLFDINGNPVYNQQPQQQPQQQQQDARAEIDKMWETDPRRAVQAEIYTAMSWRDRQDALLDSQEASVASKYADYNTYRNEVRGYIRSLPIEQRANNGVVELAYYVVRGQKVDNIIAKSRETLEAEMRAKYQSGELAQGMPSGSMASIPQQQGAVTLSPEQRQAAAAFGISEADYVKNMKR